MPTVRTTSQPGVDIEVSDAEYVDLKRWGVLIDDAVPAADSAAAPARTIIPAKAVKAKES